MSNSILGTVGSGIPTGKPQLDANGSDPVEGLPTAAPNQTQLNAAALISMVYELLEKLTQLQRQMSTDSLNSELKAQNDALKEQMEGIALQKTSQLISGALSLVGSALGGIGGAAGGLAGGANGLRLGLDSGQVMQGVGQGMGSVFGARKAATSQADQAEAEILKNYASVFDKNVDSAAQSAQGQISAEQQLAQELQQSQAQVGSSVSRNMGNR